MSTPSEAPTALSWRHHVVAFFVTFHLVCILIYALPRAPSVDDQILAHPEVRAEVAASLQSIPEWACWRDTNEEMMNDLLGIVRGYTRFTEKARHRVSGYVTAIGSTQSWHMFGGTPPRFPLVLDVEIMPASGNDYVPFQDLNWGTEDSKAMSFRHRKVHENLAAWEPSRSWAAYADYWAGRWDKIHPDDPARRVRLSFTRLTTPSPEEMRRGENQRPPERGLQSFELVRP